MFRFCDSDFGRESDFLEVPIRSAGWGRDLLADDQNRSRKNGRSPISEPISGANIGLIQLRDGHRRPPANGVLCAQLRFQGTQPGPLKAPVHKQTPHAMFGRFQHPTAPPPAPDPCDVSIRGRPPQTPAAHADRLPSVIGDGAAAVPRGALARPLRPALLRGATRTHAT